MTENLPTIQDVPTFNELPSGIKVLSTSFHLPERELDLELSIPAEMVNFFFKNLSASNEITLGGRKWNIVVAELKRSSDELFNAKILLCEISILRFV